jgi:nitrate/nitrite transporter NarK
MCANAPAPANTLGQLGGIVSPVMVGRIKDLSGSTTPALYVIGTLSVVCACLLLFALPEKPRTRDKV